MISDEYWTNEVYGSFLPVLEKTLEHFKGNALEFGSGHFSTPFLCEMLKGRELHTFEYNLDWFNTVKDRNYHTDDNHHIHYIEDWKDSFIYNDSSFTNRNDWSMVFIDHSPGERRISEVENFINKCDVMVIHDFDADRKGGAYGWYKVPAMSKWIVEIPAPPGVPYPNPSTAVVSNRFDLSKLDWPKGARVLSTVHA